MAVNDTWIRNRAVVAVAAGDTDVTFGDIPLNDTILRIHGGIAVIMALPPHGSFSAIESNHIVAGIYTTTTTNPTLRNASSQAGDFAPPLQRWLWWEQMYPVSQSTAAKAAYDTSDKYIYLPTQVPLDIKAQTKATTAISLHLQVHMSAIPSNVAILDLWYWFAVLRSGL